MGHQHHGRALFAVEVEQEIEDSAAMSGTTSERGAWPIVTMPIFALLIIPDGAPFTRPRPGEAVARLG